jgi:hypothetical protein
MHSVADSFFLRVYVFLQQLPVRILEQTPGRDLVQGCSWLELLVYFELCGGYVCSGAATPQRSITNTLAQFKRTVLQVCDVSLDHQQRSFFAPSKVAARRLKSLCFSNHCACFNAQVFFPEHLQSPLRNSLLSLRMAITMQVSEHLDKGSVFIKDTKIPMKGAPAWRRTHFFKSSKVIDDAIANIEKRDVFGSSFDALGAVFLTCPVGGCGQKRDVSRVNLFTHGKWASLSCPACVKTHTVRKWLCPCGLPWYGCGYHSNLGFCCGISKGRGVKRVLADPPFFVKPLVSNFEQPPRTPIDASIGVDGPPPKRLRFKQRNLKRSLSFTSEQREAVSSVARMRVLRESCDQAHSSCDAQRPASGVSLCTDVVSGATGLRSSSSS